MTVRELNREQLTQLKARYLDDKNIGQGSGTSWGEIANASDIITDEEIYAAFEGVNFSEGDFYR